LAVKLELSSDDWVLAPAMHVQRGFSKNEGSRIRNTGINIVRSITVLKGSNKSRIKTSGIQRNLRTSEVWFIVRIMRAVPVSSEGFRDISIHSTCVLEKTTGINEGTGIMSDGLRTSEGMDSVRKSINGVSVVEWLCTKNLEEKSITNKGGTVINILIRLDNPDEFLHRVVEVQLDLVRGGTNGLITSELKLSDQILVRILGHSAALISVQEDIVNIEGSSDQRLVVGNSSRNWAANRELTVFTRVW
jgi:hypothetical protein